MIVIALCLLTALESGIAPAAAWPPSPEDLQVPLWAHAAPDPEPDAGPEFVVQDEKLVAGKPWIAVERVSQPTVTVYPPTAPSVGAAVVVFPGGGYQVLAIDLEGTEVCDWLTAKGVTCVLLKYRVPGEGHRKSGAYPDSPVALEDAQRALGWVRLHAPEWNVDPHKIGVLGFSAGGHLVAAISTNFKRRLYPITDEADRTSCRPDFGIVLYPGHLLEHARGDTRLNPYVPVTASTPPTFMVQAEDDPVDTVKNSLVYFAALHRAGVPTELHIYPHGGHAFGLRRTAEPITEWPQLAERWLAGLGVLPSK